MISFWSDYFDQATVLLLAWYVLTSITFVTALTNVQALSFPVLNGSTSSNKMFILFTLVLSTQLVTSDLCCAIFHGSFVSTFFCDFFQLILLFSTFCFVYLTREFVQSKKIVSFEYELIISFSLLGLAVLNMCNDFLTFYLAIELQSLCFYVLAGYDKNSEYCAEAGVKYFVLGAFSSGLLLFGFTLFYACFGTISFESIERTSTLLNSLLAVAGCLFFSSAILFKLGAFPFHMWLCDVYDGSMVNITAFFSTIPKLIMLTFFLKTTFLILAGVTPLLNFLFVASGVGSISFASVAALYQKRIKRLLAYSTVSHTGFMILGLYCCTIDSLKACILYIVVYILMTLTMFSLLFLSGFNNTQQKYLINWTSMYERNAAVAIVLSLLLLSMAGVPPLAGFYTKLCVLLSIIANDHVLVTVLIAIFSSIGCFYYIRLTKILFFTSKNKSLLWFGSGTKNIEMFVSLAISFIVLFLSRSNLFIDCCVLTSMSLM